MFASFLNAINTAIKIIQFKKNKKISIFTEIIEPIYLEMPIVVNDYLSLFHQALTSLNSASNNEHYNSINDIIARRNDLLSSRIKVREMAKAIKDNFQDEKIINFANNIIYFFHSSQITAYKNNASPSKELVVELHDLLQNPDLNKEELSVNIKRTLNNIESRWALITQSYAMLKLEYVN